MGNIIIMKKIFDCFTFFNELELLHLRFMEYYDIVDYFVIVESTKSHTGKQKDLIFQTNKSKFNKYLDKVIHVIVEDLPDYQSNDIWTPENFQRNCISRGLDGIAEPGDIIFVSDCDEFWDTDRLEEIKTKNIPCVFEQELFYYWINCKQNCTWTGTCSAPYGSMTPQEMRNFARFNPDNVIKNGGWHYSYQGGANKIKEKVENIAESQVIINDVGTIDDINIKMNSVIDLWGRKDNYAKKRIIVPKYKPKQLDNFIKIYPDFYNKTGINKKNIEIISLIYCSEKYLELITNELINVQSQECDWDIGIRIVANDANERVINKLKTSGINYTIYNDPKPDDYYINRVYRCYNNAVLTSEYDNVCLVNSDMVFSKNWLKNILKHHDGINIPTSRLYESGKMPSGKYGVSCYCGDNPDNLDYAKWYKISDEMAKQDSDIIKLGGLFMPAIFEKERFIESGMYPEGNIYQDGTIGTLNGNVIKSGDHYFFEEILEKKFGMKHITVFDSLCYHIQEGERDEFLGKGNKNE